jgi:hypothetical protein
MTTCRVKTSGQYARLFSFFFLYTQRERERTQSHDQKFSSQFISFFLISVWTRKWRRQKSNGSKGKRGKRRETQSNDVYANNVEHGA